jgi:hypothetical protein
MNTFNGIFSEATLLDFCKLKIFFRGSFLILIDEALSFNERGSVIVSETTEAYYKQQNTNDCS